MLKAKEIKRGKFYISVSDNTLIKAMTAFSEVENSSICLKMIYRYVNKSKEWYVKEGIWQTNSKDSMVSLEKFQFKKYLIEDYEWLGGEVKKVPRYQFINEKN